MKLLLSAVIAVLLWISLLVAQEQLITSYDLTITPYFFRSDGLKQNTFFGEADIIVKCIHTCGSDIFLDSEGITYHKTEVYQQTTNLLLVTSFYQDVKYIALTVIGGMTNETEYKVSLNFTGHMGLRWGLQLFSYYAPNGVMHYFVWTKMERTKARTVFPHFDEPAQRHPFHIAIIRPVDYQCFSNAPLGDKETVVGLRRKDWFKPTPPIPGYMVSFVVLKLGDVPRHTTIHLSRTYLQKFTGAAGEVILHARRFYRELYEYMENPRGHVVGIFQFPRGVVIQNLGLGIFDEEILLSDNRSMGIIDEQIMKAKVSSAQAQSWIADTMNPSKWEDDWIKTGLAIFYEYIGTHAMYPKYDLDIQFVTDVTQRAMRAGDFLVNFPMLYLKELETEYVDSVFNSLRNARAAAFLHMLNHAMSRPRFRYMVKRFISGSAWRTYDTKEFFETVVLTWPPEPFLEDKDAFLYKWLRCPDVPVVSVSLSADKKSAILVQKTNLTANKQNEVYPIPITFTTNNSRDFETTFPSFFMNATWQPTVINFTKPISWIMLNIRQVGFYRVLYTDELYKAIGSELMKPNFTSIHQLNRAQFVDDLFPFYIRKFVSSQTVGKLLKYLRKEEDYAPWKAAMNGMTYFSSLLHPDELPFFGEFVLHLTANIYNKLGILPKENETVLDIHLRNVIINANCRFGNENATKAAVDIVKDYLYDRIPIPGDIAAAVICCAVRTKDNVLFNDIYDMYQKEPFLKFKRKMLDGLACASTPLAVETYVNLTMHYSIPVEEKEDHLYKLLQENPQQAWFVFQLVLRDILRFAYTLENKPRMAQVMYNIGILLRDADQWSYWKYYSEEYAELYFRNSMAVTSAYDVQDLHKSWKDSEYSVVKPFLCKKMWRGSGSTVKGSTYLQLFMIIFLFQRFGFF